MTHRPIGPRAPLRSARSTKSLAGSRPWRGCCQRSNASAATTGFPGPATTMGPRLCERQSMPARRGASSVVLGVDQLFGELVQRAVGPARLLHQHGRRLLDRVGQLLDENAGGLLDAGASRHRMSQPVQFLAEQRDGDGSGAAHRLGELLLGAPVELAADGHDVDAALTSSPYDEAVTAARVAWCSATVSLPRLATCCAARGPRQRRA